VRLNLAAGYQGSGDYRLAEQTLRSAREIAEEMQDASREAAVLNALGSTLTFLQVFEEAGETFDLAMKKAEEAGDVRGKALIQNNLGNLSAARQRFEEAIAAYTVASE